MEFYPPDDGQIWFAGQRIDGLTPDRVAAAGINRTYQTIRLFRNLTAIENILVGMHIHLQVDLVRRRAQYPGDPRRRGARP